MFLESAHQRLGWPSQEEIFSPRGSGVRVQVEQANRKIGATIGRISGDNNVRTGLLTIESRSNSTDPPIAIVVEFSRSVGIDVLRELHKLAWNFAKAPLLITIEPTLVRSWSCCEPPQYNPVSSQLSASIEDASINFGETEDEVRRAERALHWIELASGRFFEQRPTRFQRDLCADRMLLSNLRAVRQTLLADGLNEDLCHDLLARLVFIQYLFDRKDSSGRAALNEQRLTALHNEGILSSSHTTLASLLRHYSDTYKFFRWLNDKFNGDLFPGSGLNESERKAAWRLEQEHVTSTHLGMRCPHFLYQGV